MNIKLERRAKRYAEAHGRKRRWRKVVTALAAVVVFCTTYALIMPAVTMQSQTYCGQEEHAEHTEACYQQVKTLTCGLSEESHVHDENCYKTEKVLTCERELHRHTLQCYSDLDANVESASAWESTFSSAELTGKWPDDVLAIARTQIGYQESAQNYRVQSDGTTIKGYTRYGDWYGCPYGDWCAMFCSFCLHYAGVDQELVPLAANCEDWIQQLSQANRYHGSSTYTPKPGDLIFIDWDGEGLQENLQAAMDHVDHVGFVYEVIAATDELPARVKTIEGNNGDEVAYHTYDLDSACILGYGELPEQADPLKKAGSLLHAPMQTALTLAEAAQENGEGKPQPGYAPDAYAISGAKTGDIADISAVIPGADGRIGGAYVSDPATSAIEDQFFSTAAVGKNPSTNDGKLLSDKSVIYQGDDYGAFASYDEDTFGVTLSVLGQDYQMKDVDQVKIPVDVVFVLDVSGSMGNAAGNVTRREAVVNAVNSAMQTIMNDNPENRAGVVLYSSGGSTLLNLDHYTAGSQNTYLSYNKNDGDIYTAGGLQGTKGKITVTNGETGGFTQGHGTYTQYGIALGAQMLQNNGDTTYTTTLRPGTAEEQQVTVTRQPVIILLSDGDPTHCNTKYNDVFSGPHYGSGVYTNNDRNDNNKGIHGYYTILSANYYKREVGNHYNTPAMFYTIGMGINETGYDDMSGQSRTGDHYKRAVLNPTSANISALTNTGAKNYGSTSHQLRDLLNNQITSNYVTVAATNDYTQLGTTRPNVPVIRNPYSENYSYADGAYFGNLSASDLQEIFGRIISGNLNIKRYGYMLSENTRMVVTDEIGAGMELKGMPVLRYNGVNYALEQQGEGDQITYVCHETATTSDGSQRTADLSQIKIRVTTENGRQTVSMELPNAVIPTYSPSFSEDWYYEELPVRLIYQVGLNADAKAAIEALQPGETLTYYTNAWEDTTALAGHQPHQDNPYYHDVTYDDGTSRTKQYKDYSTNKTKNATATAETSVNSGEVSDVIRTDLGNNGKLVFEGLIPASVPLTIQKTDMNGYPITTGPAEFALYGDEALQNRIDTYTTDGEGKLTIEKLTPNTPYYLLETKAPDGYYRLPEAQKFTVDVNGNVTGIEVNKYFRWDSTNHVLLIYNTDGYQLPESGGAGTILYTFCGLLLMAGPAMYGYAVRRKREGRAD